MFSERVDNWAKKITRRLELAMGYRLFDPEYRFTSDNYQIMNYGYGGTISLHKDASTHISDIGIGVGYEQYIVPVLTNIFRWWKANNCDAVSI